MKRTEFKLLAVTVLLSGFSVGYIHAGTHLEAVRMYVSQQENECKGVVLDETGETVIGASVLVKGTSNGTITDLDGNFAIQNVKKGDVIVVSYVGYKNVETVWDGTNLRIILKSNAEELDEVNPAKRKATPIKNEKRFSEQKRKAMKIIKAILEIVSPLLLH